MRFYRRKAKARVRRERDKWKEPKHLHGKRWQGAGRWKQGWNDAWRGWGDSTTTTPSTSEQISDVRVTNALMQDRINDKKQLLKHVSGRQRQGAYVSTNAKKLRKPRRYREAIKDTLRKTEAIEKHVKTVTLRAESLASTEADFFKNTPRPTRGNAEALE